MHHVRLFWCAAVPKYHDQSEGEGTASAATTAGFFLVVVVALVVLVVVVVLVPRGGTQAEYRPDNKMRE